MTTDQIAELVASLGEKLDRASQSPLPWRYRRQGWMDCIESDGGAVASFEIDDDAELSVAAVNALPTLLDALTAAQARVEELADDVRIWKGEAENRSERMIELNLDRAAQGVEIMQLQERATAAEAEIAGLRAALQKIGNFRRGGVVNIGTPEHDRDAMIGVARSALREDTTP